MIDSVSQLRTATRRAKSDVANKLVSMFLHELSRRVSQNWPIKIEGQQYEDLVRARFGNQCPYCSRSLADRGAVVEHLDGMNRYRVGLHVPGNVLVACKDCNSEKRRDDSLKVLSLAEFGWESFLSHTGVRCPDSCRTCKYWETIWVGNAEREEHLRNNLERIRAFRNEFQEFRDLLPFLRESLPGLLAKLYSDCQSFAEAEIKGLMDKFDRISCETLGTKHGPVGI